MQRRLVEVDARLMRAALALKINPSTILRPADNLLRSSIQLNSTVEKNEVWCLAAPVPHGGFVQDLLREAHWKSREHRVIHLPHRAEIVTHIGMWVFLYGPVCFMCLHLFYLLLFYLLFGLSYFCRFLQSCDFVLVFHVCVCFFFVLSNPFERSRSESITCELIHSRIPSGFSNARETFHS